MNNSFSENSETAANLKAATDALDRFMSEVRPERSQPQHIYVMEECAELMQECSKYLRGKGNSENLTAEIADVLAASLVILRDMNVSESELFSMIKQKYDRAVERFKNSKEL